ncbi:MAG: phosphate regulon sensor histidine kinase PhoR [Rhodanobacteraceae bacterium]|nr:phosphate regulon sensor histidine kinase PhoR [Rhodanobacteraceae bacterium]
MTHFRAAERSIALLLVLAGLGVLVGWLLGQAGFGMAGGLLLWSALQLRQLLRLQRWLASRRMHAPESEGAWQPIFDSLERRRKADRRRRRRLLEALEAFRDAARALPDGIIAIDDTDTIHWFNKSAKRLLGLRYPTDVGNHLTHLVRSPRFMQWLGEGRLDDPLIDLPSPGDERVRLLCRLIAYRPGFRMLIVRDVSNLMRLEQIRRDFVANVSHELRTPLTVINGYMEALEPEELGELGGLFVQMRQQSRRMAHIVEDLLTLSRLEAQSMPVAGQVAMRPLLGTILRDAQALSAGRHRIELCVSTELDLLGSGKDLHSAFSNLVVNAVRYTPDGGEIRLVWEMRDQDACFSVSDTGPGIPAQHLPRLTERFYRVSNSRSRDSGGTGLGLAIVKHVLNSHGARLEIESRVGEGSCFRCVFPTQCLHDRSAAGHSESAHA